MHYCYRIEWKCRKNDYVLIDGPEMLPGEYNS